MCDEEWLLDSILQMRAQRQKSLGQARRKELLERNIRELVELMAPRTAAAEGETTGRESGSLAWRQARGELGDGSARAEEPKHEPTVIKPTKNEVDQLCLHLVYCCAVDEYKRVSEDNHVTKGWERMIFEASHVFRKEEEDWNMVYLARTEGSPEASVSWKFDFTGTAKH